MVWPARMIKSGGSAGGLGDVLSKLEILLPKPPAFTRIPDKPRRSIKSRPTFGVMNRHVPPLPKSLEGQSPISEVWDLGGRGKSQSETAYMDQKMKSWKTTRARRGTDDSLDLLKTAVQAKTNNKPKRRKKRKGGGRAPKRWVWGGFMVTIPFPKRGSGKGEPEGRDVTEKKGTVGEGYSFFVMVYGENLHHLQGLAYFYVRSVRQGGE